MVCGRCITAVQRIFADAGIQLLSADLGELETVREVTGAERMMVEAALNANGFELLEDIARQEIERVKTFIILTVDSLDISEDFLLSKSLATHLNKDYSSISKNFSQLETTTLEQYFILQKIEKVKELLSYGEYSLTEIAGKLGYRSVQHLSAQFKTVTGFTPSDFRKIKAQKRFPLDQV